MTFFENILEELSCLTAIQDDELCRAIQEVIVRSMKERVTLDESLLKCFTKIIGRIQLPGQSYVLKTEDYNLIEILKILIDRVRRLHQGTRDPGILISGLTTISRVIDNLVDIGAEKVSGEDWYFWKRSLNAYAKGDNEEVAYLAQYALAGLLHINMKSVPLLQRLRKLIEGSGNFCIGVIAALCVPTFLAEGPLLVLFAALATPVFLQGVLNSTPALREAFSRSDASSGRGVGLEGTIEKILLLCREFEEKNKEDEDDWYLFLRILREGLLLWFTQHLQGVDEAKQEEHQKQFDELLGFAEAHIKKEYRYAYINLLVLVTYLLEESRGFSPEQLRRLTGLFFLCYSEIEEKNFRRRILESIDYLTNRYFPAQNEIFTTLMQVKRRIAEHSVSDYSEIIKEISLPESGKPPFIIPFRQLLSSDKDDHKLMDRAISDLSKDGMTPPYQQDCLCARAQYHLSKVYQTYRIPRLLPQGTHRGLPPFSRKYIHLTLVQGKKEKTESEQTERMRLDERGEGNETSLDALWQPKREKQMVRAIMVAGVAGVGKTTFSHEIARSVVQKQLRLNENIRWVFLVPLRELFWSGDSAEKLVSEDLIEFIRKKYFQGCYSPNEWEYLKKYLIANRKNILWIFDGYDEVAHLRNSQTLFSLPLVERYIVTTRPYSMEKLPCDVTYNITGFNRDDIEVYIDSFFEGKEGEGINVKKLKSFLRSNASLFSISCIPINLQFICILHQSGKLVHESRESSASGEYFLTMTALYQKLIDYLLRRYGGERDKDIKGALCDVDPKTRYREKTRFLSRVAYEMVKSHRSQMSNVELISLLGELGIKETDSFLSDVRDSGLLNAVPDIEKRDIDQYSFLHLTFRDFFAAQYIQEQWLSPKESEREEIAKFIEDNKKDESLEVMWWFVAGLLKNQETRWFEFIKLLCDWQDDSRKFSLLVRCIEEGEKTKSRSAESYLKKIHSLFMASDLKKGEDVGSRLYDDKDERIQLLCLCPRVLRSSYILRDLEKFIRSERWGGNQLSYLLYLKYLGGFALKIKKARKLFLRYFDGLYGIVRADARVEQTLEELIDTSSIGKYIERVVRGQVIQQLRVLAKENRQAQELLFNYCENSITYLDVRQTAIGELSVLAQECPKARELLFKCCEDSDVRVRQAAIMRLKFLAKKYPKARELLFKGCEDSDVRVRQEAITELGILVQEDPEARGLLLKFCDTPNIYLQRRATEMLGNLVQSFLQGSLEERKLLSKEAQKFFSKAQRFLRNRIIEKSYRTLRTEFSFFKQPSEITNGNPDTQLVLYCKDPLTPVKKGMIR